MLRLGEKIPNRGSIQAVLSRIGNITMDYQDGNSHNYFYGAGVPTILDPPSFLPSYENIMLTRIGRTTFNMKIIIKLNTEPLLLWNVFKGKHKDNPIFVNIHIPPLLKSSFDRRLNEIGLNLDLGILEETCSGSMDLEIGYRPTNGNIDGYNDFNTMKCVLYNLYRNNSGVILLNGSREGWLDDQHTSDDKMYVKYLYSYIDLTFNVTEASLLPEKKPKVNSTYFSIFSHPICRFVA